MGIFENSIQELEKHILTEPKSLEAHFILAELYYTKGNMELCKKNLFTLVNLDEKKEYYRQITDMLGPQMVSSDNYYNSRPIFSSDGSHIAFSSAREDTNSDGRINSHDNSGIYMVNIKTGEEYYLVSNAVRSKMPIFSPDNQKLLYQSWRRDTNNDGKIDSQDNSGTFLLDLATGAEKEIVPDRYKTKYPSIFPGSKRVLYVCYKNAYDNAGIYMLDLETMKDRQLVPSKYENTFPSISPDGERIVYCSWHKDTNGDGKIDLRDNSGVYMHNMVTGEEKCIADETYNNFFPIFTPDGEHIIFLSIRRDTNGDGRIDTLDNAGIYIRDLSGGNERCIVEDTHYNKFLSVSYDGKYVCFVSRHVEGETGAVKTKEDLYLNKGIYIAEIETGKMTELVSPKYFGTKSPVFSPTENAIVYQAWRKGKRRGLYLVRMAEYSKDEIMSFISKNI